MPYRVQVEADIPNGFGIPANGNHAGGGNPGKPLPQILSANELLAMRIPAPEMLVENLLPMRGASLLNGAAKSGKTVLATQLAIAVASGEALFGQYRVQRGAALLLEQDDPGATASVKDILTRSAVPVAGIPFYVVPRVPWGLGPEFLDWIEGEIVRRSLKLAVLDSFTALRGSRARGGDIAKQEQDELAQLDAVAKRTNCAVLILHHVTASKSGMDWSLQLAGSFAMAASTESQMHISRFPEMDGGPERLVHVRGRHQEDREMVLRFRRDTLDYEHVLEGGAAGLYPLLLELRAAFGKQSFSPKDVAQATGVSIRTVHRQLDRLYRADALHRHGHGEYALRPEAQA